MGEWGFGGWDGRMGIGRMRWACGDLEDGVGGCDWEDGDWDDGDWADGDWQNVDWEDADGKMKWDGRMGMGGW